MKNTSYYKKLKQYLPVFLACDFVFIFIIYILAEDLLIYLINFILIFTLLALAFIFYSEYKREKKIKKLVYNFLEDPSFESKDKLIEEIGIDYRKIVTTAFNQINSMKEQIDDRELALISYREFIEEWTHEIKTPLLISNLLLQNHSDELSLEVKEKLKYINSSFENSIDKILYYARSDLNHMDYRMKNLSVASIIDEVLEKYYPLIGEKGIIVRRREDDFNIFSDESVVSFIISQIIDNACKYTENLIEIQSFTDINYNHLEIIDNGKKVHDKDLPFIFEKGFTGLISYKQKPTGMGLYLVKKYSIDLGIKVEVGENKEERFSIRLSFPKVK